MTQFRCPREIHGPYRCNLPRGHEGLCDAREAVPSEAEVRAWVEDGVADCINADSPAQEEAAVTELVGRIMAAIAKTQEDFQ